MTNTPSPVAPSPTGELAEGLTLAAVSLTLGAGAAAVTALDTVDLRVAPGEFVAVVGPSGSGKSSLLGVAGALRRPTSGRITVAGVELTALGDKQLTALRLERIGFMFQQANLFASLTVREQLLLPVHLRRTDLRAAWRRADELIEVVGLGHRVDRRPHQLSGGERQRVGLARALMGRPAVLLVDEPTAALDRARSAEVVALLAEQTRREGVATVMVTHDHAILDSVDTVHELRDGRLART